MTPTDDDTPLDAAHAAHMAAAGSASEEATRRAWYAEILAGELCLLLQDEPQGDAVRPRVFPLDDGPVVLAFDREDRLAAFAGGPAPYAAMPGRALVRMLADSSDRKLGLGLNLGSPSALLMPPEMLAWLAEGAAAAPQPLAARIVELTRPAALPEALVRALDARLARASGLAEAAYLAGAVLEGGGRSQVLAFAGARPGAEAALSLAVAEALALAGQEETVLDVVFLTTEDALRAPLERVALRFDLPANDASAPAPGPRPPRLR